MLLLQTITIRDALNSALDEEMARDGDVFILGEEVSETLNNWFYAPADSYTIPVAHCFLF